MSPAQESRERGRLVTTFLTKRCFRDMAAKHCRRKDDIEDALQNAAESALRYSMPLDEHHARRWFNICLRHACWRLNRTSRTDAFVLTDLDRDHNVVDPIEVAETRNQLSLLSQLKTQECLALLDRALGLSYDEIGVKHDWTYTKVNRCISEGRARLRGLVEVAA